MVNWTCVCRRIVFSRILKRWGRRPVPGNDFHVHVRKDLLSMFILDDWCDTVMEDIITHDLPRLDAADVKLAEYGFTRTTGWDGEGTLFFYARAVKTR